MLDKFQKRKEVNDRIDKIVNSILDDMEVMQASTDEFEMCAKNLEKIFELQRNKQQHWRVNPDTLATIIANSAWILLILKYEESDSILSKAFGFILKGRV